LAARSFEAQRTLLDEENPSTPPLPQSAAGDTAPW
jgi:hypothetical protein